VLGVSEARHLLAWLTAVDQLMPVAETTQAQGHHRLEPLEFFVGQLDVPTVGAHGQIDPLVVAPGPSH